MQGRSRSLVDTSNPQTRQQRAMQERQGEKGDRKGQAAMEEWEAQLECV